MPPEENRFFFCSFSLLYGKVEMLFFPLILGSWLLDLPGFPSHFSWYRITLFFLDQTNLTLLFYFFLFPLERYSCQLHPKNNDLELQGTFPNIFTKMWPLRTNILTEEKTLAFSIENSLKSKAYSLKYYFKITYVT